MRFAWIVAAIVLHVASPSWSSPWESGVNPSHDSFHADSEMDEATARTAVENAFGIEDSVHRAAALLKSANAYVESLTSRVARRIACLMCLRAGERLALLTRKIKDEVSLIDEIANMCRGTDEDDAGWVQELQEAGWEIHNDTLIQIVDEEKRIDDINMLRIQSWMLQRACNVVFAEDFEFALMAEWLAFHFIEDEDAVEVDLISTQDKLCIKRSDLRPGAPMCQGEPIKKSDRRAVIVQKKAKPAATVEHDPELDEDYHWSSGEVLDDNGNSDIDPGSDMDDYARDTAIDNIDLFEIDSGEL